MECGFQNPKLYGKCPQCGMWNSMIETRAAAETADSGGPAVQPVHLKDVDQQQLQRHMTDFKEFDRVLGGGIVPDSIVLIGGEPGVGKSTLLLEISGILSQQGKKVLYYSGEESALQIKTRAQRLETDADDIFLLTMGSLEDVRAAVEKLKPEFLIIDSIQTIQSRKGPLISGSISTMRYVTAEISELAKKDHITVFIIGHITKEGVIAGPKMLEHMVDAVLYFQGELKSDLRILRAEKNRFGPVNELGIFQMTGRGLKSVVNPSPLFLQHRQSADTGIATFPTVSGLRAILIEIQSLVAESPFTGNPRRIAVGFDHYRMSMLISIIEKKLKLPFYKSDVFLNITGGINIRETAADLAIVTALISSYKNFVVPHDVIIIGEVGLTGEIRPVGLLENRLKEAIRQGFKQFILPACQSDISHLPDITISPAQNIYDLYNLLKPQKSKG